MQTPQEFPALYQLSLNDRTPQRLAERYLGSTAGIGAGRIYFDQQEVRRNAGLYSDLYALDRKTGVVRPLTRGARLMDPDLSPDGRALVCVQDRPGHRDFVLVALGREAQASGPEGLTIETLVSEAETQFSAPRWSPDGRTVVVERHAPGRQSELAIVDVATQRVRTLASNPRARFVTPTWRPDGRTIVVAADLADGPFQLYELHLAAVDSANSSDTPRLRQLTSASGGATWPDFSPDGKTLVFVGYTDEGFDLFSMSYRDISDRPSFVAAMTQVTANSVPPFEDAVLRSAPYNPLRTLFPTSWSPIVSGDRNELRVGLTTSGGDVLGYHGYTVSASWLVSNPDRALLPPAARPDWQAIYQYTRWQPTFWMSASSQTSFYAGPADSQGVPTAATLQERQIEAGVLFPVRRVRTSQTTLVSFVRSDDDLQLSDALETTRRAAIRAGWGLNSARTYGYSISPEGGITVGATTELARQALGSSGDATTVTADGRMYLPLGRDHQVLAVRLAGGFSTGDAQAQRTFVLGGAQPNVATLDFGDSAISLLRGFPPDSFAGTHVALLNADYRWPVAWPERGHGTWPLFLRSLHAAVFADAGKTWTQQFDGSGLKLSAGGELSVDFVAGYFTPLSATLGAAWGHDYGRSASGGGSVYVRLGRAF